MNNTSLRKPQKKPVLFRRMTPKATFRMLNLASHRWVAQNHFAHRNFASRPRRKDDGSLYLVRAGLPLILFCGLGVWVVANGIEGRNKERDMFQGRVSKSERQHLMEQEHDEMMDKLNHIVSQDFDNTKRIERPEEVLARRRQEREARNVWYRRYWRKIRGQD